MYSSGSVKNLEIDRRTELSQKIQRNVIQYSQINIAPESVLYANIKAFINTHLQNIFNKFC